MQLALAIGSFVILLVHGVVFYNQFFHDWERYQTAYFDQARGLAKTDAERAAVTGRSARIEQVIVTNFGEKRVDRCLTCHTAVDDPRFTQHAHPTKTHPYSEALGDVRRNGQWERRHKFADFGCTVCHDGQGRGLQEHYSHGEDHFWPDPLLGFVTQAGWRADYTPHLKGTVYMEANCAQCHTEENFPGTATVQQGRELFFKSNCYGCHRIEGMSDGTLGPDLSDGGKKFKLDYLWEAIDDPRANLATSVMPKFNLTTEETRALVIFLKSRKGKNLSETEIQRYRLKLTGGAELVQAAIRPVTITPAAMLEQGKDLVRDRACLACHKLGDEDGGIAPDLTYEGLLKEEDWLFAHFRNPRSTVADSIMPAFRFTDDEFRAMSAYLASLRPAPRLASAAETYRALCERCHGEKGDGHGTIAIYLDPYPRDLTKAGFMNSKPVERLAGSIRDGVPGTSMPGWGRLLDDAQINGLLDHIQTEFTRQPRRELKARKVPDANPVAMSAESAARGEAMFVRRCGGCHGRKADGKGPNSLDILPRPRNLRNAPFVHSTNDARMFDAILYGVQGTAMPPWIDYGLSVNDVGDLVNFIRSLNPEQKESQYARTD
ncbi:MAG: c-type cytochrome [Bryobacterales bacterium]|nr:c-type cytochrome [Bryobacterales bacterium]